MVECLKYAIALFLIVIIGIKITNFITKKVKVNRWIVGGCAPLVLIIPSIVFPDMGYITKLILQVIFSLMCVMFFEITRKMVENNEIKGMHNYSMPVNKKTKSSTNYSNDKLLEKNNFKDKYIKNDKNNKLKRL